MDLNQIFYDHAVVNAIINMMQLLFVGTFIILSGMAIFSAILLYWEDK